MTKILGSKIGVGVFLHHSFNKAHYKRANGERRYPIHIRITFQKKLITFRSNFMLFSTGMKPAAPCHPAADKGLEISEWSTFIDQFSLTPYVNLINDKNLFSQEEFYLIKKTLANRYDEHKQHLRPKDMDIELVVNALTKELDFIGKYVSLVQDAKVNINFLGTKPVLFSFCTINQTLDFYVKGLLAERLKNSEQYLDVYHLIDWLEDSRFIINTLRKHFAHLFEEGGLLIEVKNLPTLFYLLDQFVKIDSANRESNILWMTNPDTFKEFRGFLKKHVKDPERFVVLIRTALESFFLMSGKGPKGVTVSDYTKSVDGLIKAMAWDSPRD
jgi:hypothetical protein